MPAEVTACFHLMGGVTAWSCPVQHLYAIVACHYFQRLKFASLPAEYVEMIGGELFVSKETHDPDKLAPALGSIATCY